MSVPSLPTGAPSPDISAGTVTQTSPSASPVAHPTACPSWCKDRRHPQGHHFGPTATWHWGTQYHLANPAPLDGDAPIIVRAELFRSDEGNQFGEVSMYLSGETDIEMGRDEVDVFIIQAQAFVDGLRVMRRQMG